MSTERIDVLAALDERGGVIMAQVGGRQVVHRVPREIAEGIIQREAAVAELIEAAGIMEKAFYPVSKDIDPRGYRWSESYLDQALPILRAALARFGQVP